MWRKIRYNFSIVRQKSAEGCETLSIHNDTVMGLVILTGQSQYAGLVLTGFGRVEGVDCVA